MECSSVSGRMAIVSTGEGAGSSLVSRTEQSGLPDDLLRKTFEYLTAYEQGTMRRVSEGFGELAVMERPDLLQDLENFHKALTEILSDPLIEKTLAEGDDSLLDVAKEMIEQIRVLEGILASRLKREKQAEVLSIRLMAGKRNLSKEEAGIYKELMENFSDEVRACLVYLLPAHQKVINQIQVCKSALTSLHSPEQFQEWAREGKFELTKMLFDSMQRERQTDFGYNFAVALLQEGDIENAHPVANSVPDPHMRRRTVWEVYRAYLLCGDLENAFKIAKEDFTAPNIPVDEADADLPVAEFVNFTGILEEFAVREDWKRVEEGITILAANQDKASSINYRALSYIAQSKWKQKENFLRAIEFIKKDKSRLISYEIAKIVRDLLLRYQDYELAEEIIRRDIDSVEAKEIALQDKEIVSLLTERKVEEAKSLVAAKSDWYIKDRGFSTIALFYAKQGNKEEAMRYHREIRGESMTSENCLRGIEIYLLERR